MALRAGRLRHTIEILQQSQTKSPTGGPSATQWAPVYEVRARVTYLSVKDTLAAQAVQSQTVARCTIRHSKTRNITSDMRVKHGGRIYKIDGPPKPDDKSGREYITLMLESIE